MGTKPIVLHARFSFVSAVHIDMVARSTQLLFHALAIPFASALMPISDPSTLNVDVQLSNNISNYANVSKPAVCGAAIVPYSFNVPNSHVSLRIGFGLRRRSLNSMDMRELLVIVKDDFDEAAGRLGPNTLWPLYADGLQQIDYDLGVDVRIFIQNTKSGRYFSLKTLQDLVQGLHIYLIDGKRYRETFFNFFDGAGRSPVGMGCIERMEMDTS